RGRENSSSVKEECGRHEPEGQKNVLPRQSEGITVYAECSPEPGSRGQAPSPAKAGGGRSSVGNEYEEDYATTRLQDQRIHRLSVSRCRPDRVHRGAGGRRCAA